MIPCHSAALRCTWPFAVTCMTPSSIENEIAHLTVAAFSSHLSRLRREERLVMTAYCAAAAVPHCYGALPAESRAGPQLPPAASQRAAFPARVGALPVRIAVEPQRHWGSSREA